MAFRVGINFPWIACGHDFGPRPPPWAGAAPTDWENAYEELCRLREDGVRIARWWILAGGVNLPCGSAVGPFADRVAAVKRWPWWKRRAVRRRSRVPERFAARRALPPLPARFLEDFERLLQVCARADVQLWPSLFSFELLLPIDDQGEGVSSGGRGSFATDPFQSAFFDATLEPLLEVSARYRATIAAWEVANEPGWARKGGFVERFAPHPGWIDDDVLSQVLMDGVRRISARGFRASIGFIDHRPAWLSPYARAALRRLAGDGRYVHQMHHYPSVTKLPALPPVERSFVRPCIVGELPTSRAHRWDEPHLAEDDEGRYLERRLERVRELGYEAALLWAYRATDPHVRWDEVTRAQVRRVAARA